MSETTESQQHKQRVTGVFNTIADGYGNTALRFFPFTADQIVDILRPRSGSKVLDVATGTGVVALAFAQAVGASGRVHAIDLSEAMLVRAMANAQHMGMGNIDFFTMDAERPDFRNDYYDYVVSSFGLFFLPDMHHALRQWRRVCKPGGKVLFTSFAETAFRPAMDLFAEQLAAHGVETKQAVLASQRLVDPAVCQQLLIDNEFSEVTLENRQCGYHLQSLDEYWSFLWNSGARGLIQQLDQQRLPAFKEELLRRVSELFDEKGMWLDVTVNFVSGVA